jgi:hypothetical protein
LLMLIFISVIGLGLSVIIHICSLFHICEPPRWLIILISVGIIIVLYPTIIIERTTRKRLGIESFKDAMVKTIPKCLVTINGVFILYALGWIIFLIFKKYFTDTGVNDFRGPSGIWMVSYSWLFTTLYCYRRLKERKPSSETH